MEGEALHYFLPAIEAEEENGVENALACDDGGQMAMQATLDIPEPRNRRQAMDSPEWDEWWKAEETKMLGMVENRVYKQVARPKDKLVAGTKMLYEQNIGKDGKVEKYKCADERFNDWGGRGYDDFVPWEVTKTAPSGD